MSNEINYAAVRAFNRALAPHDKALSEIDEADDFDRDDWDEHINACDFEEIERCIADQVGKRFGISDEELLDMVTLHMWREDAKRERAQSIRDGWV